jgi:hypothetical protein
MSAARPTLVAIDHDDYDASHVGRLADGRQFFGTTPFLPASENDAGREFIAVYLFDARGALLDAHVDDLGPRGKLDEDRAKQLLEKRLASLGPATPGRIEVSPFEVERFGTTFGLVARAPEVGEVGEAGEDDEGGWWVEAQPGNYMAFHEPWDSGEYDT